MNWYFQYTPGDMWDYDEVGTHILIDGVVDGQPRKLITHSARNGFLYTMERANGQTMMLAKPYLRKVNWTKGIDQKTGKPLDYDPDKDIQTYSGVGNFVPGEPTKKVCPSHGRRQQLLAVVLQPEDEAALHPGAVDCATIDDRPREASSKARLERRPFTTQERYESNLVAVDPLTGEIKKSVHLRYPNYQRHARHRRRPRVHRRSLDGTVAAYDDTTLDQLWKINVGSGFNAPPMTFEANGKQYVAIVSGSSPVARGRSPTRRNSGAAQRRLVLLRVRAVNCAFEARGGSAKRNPPAPAAVPLFGAFAPALGADHAGHRSHAQH